jgi:DNA-binding transcriptional LysR family regulator
MDLRHLRYFAAVAEERHFGRAAKRLGIAQPPLSRQIQALEGELGFALFQRSSRKVDLTPAGRVLYEQSRRVFDAMADAVREARRAALGETGRITIGYPSSFAFSGLVEILRAFRARSPSVEIVLRELSPQEQIDALKRSRLDVGFVRGPLEDPEVSSELVRREDLVVVLPDTHSLASSKKIALRRLAREPFVSFPRARGPAFFDHLLRLCSDAGFTPRIVQEAPQLDLVSLVAAGFGVALVPSSLRATQRPGGVFRPILDAPPADLLIVWRSADGQELERAPVVRGFLATVRRVGTAAHRSAAITARRTPSKRRT